MSTRKHKNDRFTAVHGFKTNKSGQSIAVTRKEVAKEKKAKRALKPKKICTDQSVIDERLKNMEIRKERMRKYHIRKEAQLKAKQDAKR